MIRCRPLLLLAALAVTSHAGVTLNFEMKNKKGVSKFSIQVEGKNARIDHTEPNEPAPNGMLIRDGAGKRLLMVDLKEKTYVELTDEQVQQMKAQMEQAKAQMKAAMAKMPPEQRARMEAMMGGRGGGMGP